METAKLKKFATEARTNLMDGVRLRLRKLGFDERGHAVKAPELISGGTIWNGEEYPEEFHAQWMALSDLLLKRGVREVAETAAYTWFNRMMAIRILTRNNLCESILDPDAMTGLPRLLAEARIGRVPEMTDQQRRRYEWLMNDDMRTADQFAVLLTAWCHANPVINSCFGSIDGFVEILLPDNILKDGGFLSLLNHTEFITEEDFHSAELIGWLYQFYISDRKDEVFAKKGKVEADEIPAATQIFTPNWIVKYMVQNTIIPQISTIKDQISDISEQSDANERICDTTYLVIPEEKKLIFDKLYLIDELRVADLACGSGHILNECFDLLYDLYMAEVYSRREAIECIFIKNLLGIDIDLRAKQLATFALLLKACQKDPAFTDVHCMPRVLTVPDFTDILKTTKYEDEDGGHGKHIKHVFFQDSVTDAVATELEEAFTLLKDADSLGSIIKFDLSASALRAIKDTAEYWQSKDDAIRPEFVNDLLPAIDFIMALTDSYDTIVMNPPYMPTSRVDMLKDYAVKTYPDSKTDLFSVFMDVCIDRLKDGGKYGMINMQSWMFLSSFEALRKKIIDNQHIDSLLHLGPRTFDELSGEVVQNAAFVIAKEKPKSAGIYHRLIDGKSCSAKKEMFLSGYNRYVVADQKQFEQIPGAPIAYWVSAMVSKAFKFENIGKYGISEGQNITGNNEKYLRLFWECDNSSVGKGNKWVPTAKGGSFRRWYGNIIDVMDWSPQAREEYRNNPVARIQNSSLWYRSGITWNLVSSGGTGFRILPDDSLFNKAAPTILLKPEYANKQKNLLGFLNTPIVKYILEALNPTINTNIAEVFSLPVLMVPNENNIDRIVDSCISVSKQDWDAHETSWDFQINPLVFSIYDNGWGKLEHSVEDYEQTWEHRFRQLHANEEELNRQFIDIYGLQDELTPDVPFDEVTILQQGEISIINDQISDNSTHNGSLISDSSSLIFNRDVIIKQLISYIVGVWMGRYRLDRPWLHIAHPNPTEEELAIYQIPNSKYQFKIDEDAIIPVLPSDAPFYDNLRNYVIEFVKMVWEEEDLQENLNFMEKSLGKNLDDFLMKDFWKYHKKMYQNRPIYWEFASKKGAFRALVYAHRMDRYTVEVLRSKYLLPYIGHIERKIAALELRQNELTTAERRELDTLRNKTLPELEEYHKRVEKVAAETAARTEVFDLDDGIIRNHALFGDIVTKLK